MYLKKLTCSQFKNYRSFEQSFSQKLNIIVGENGTGKTNLLDAIHYLCLTKSALPTTDHQNIQHGKEGFFLQGTFSKDDTLHEITCRLKKKERKIIQCDDTPYEKLSDHIGLFPLILMNPYDTDLIRGSSSERRRFFDNLLCQLNHEYLNKLIQYNQFLSQRNALLKQHAETKNLDRDLLCFYNQQLLTLGQYLFQQRQHLMEDFLPLFQHYYQQIAQVKEKTSLQYDSHWALPDFEQVFEQQLPKDLLLQRTTMGIHRDDYLWELNDHPLKKIGSQGQQKSFVTALKLSQCHYIHQATGHTPLLLLDDIFDKLDNQRIQHLMQCVIAPPFGQVFITDAREMHTLEALQALDVDKVVVRTNTRGT